MAEERIREAGLEGRIRVHLLDYREIPAEFEKAFDAFVSIEMLEVILFPCAYVGQELIKRHSFTARWLQILQYVFQACGLCPQVEKRHRCGQRLYFP